MRYIDRTAQQTCYRYLHKQGRTVDVRVGYVTVALEEECGHESETILRLNLEIVKEVISTSRPVLLPKK